MAAFGAMRSLTTTDVSAVAALIRRAFGAIDAVLTPPPSGARVDQAEVGSWLAMGGGIGRDDEGVLTGCVLWRREEGGLYVGRLAVTPEAQGRGIARALMKAAEAEARRLEVPFLFLKVRLPLAGNRRLFASLGFVETGWETHPGQTSPTTARAEKRLR